MLFRSANVFHLSGTLAGPINIEAFFDPDAKVSVQFDEMLHQLGICESPVCEENDLAVEREKHLRSLIQKCLVGVMRNGGTAVL